MGNGVTQDKAEEITQATAIIVATSLAATAADGKKVSQKNGELHHRRGQDSMHRLD
jgi:hypothetical protein